MSNPVKKERLEVPIWHKPYLTIDEATLGHKDITTTLNIYTDVTKELKRTEFDGLDKYFNNSIA